MKKREGEEKESNHKTIKRLINPAVVVRQGERANPPWRKRNLPLPPPSQEGEKPINIKQ